MRALLVVLALVLTACGSTRSYAPEPGFGGADAVMVVDEEVVDMERMPGEVAPEAADRQLIRNAVLGLRVASGDEAEDAIDRAAALTDDLGGYVASQSTRRAVLRIPDERLDEALAGLEALGDVTSRDVTAQDVTAQFTDLQIRLNNARALRDRLAALLEEASGVEDVLAVERELARVTTDVERLEGQMRLLQNQIAFSTVRVNVRVGRDARPGPLGYVVVGLYEAVKWLFVWD